jgi:hypothetical protein
MDRTAPEGVAARRRDYEQRLAQLRVQIARGKDLIVRQHRLMGELIRDGRDTVAGVRVMQRLQEAQVVRLETRERLSKELSELPNCEGRSRAC